MYLENQRQSKKKKKRFGSAFQQEMLAKVSLSLPKWPKRQDSMLFEQCCETS